MDFTCESCNAADNISNTRHVLKFLIDVCGALDFDRGTELTNDGTTGLYYILTACEETLAKAQAAWPRTTP